MATITTDTVIRDEMIIGFVKIPGFSEVDEFEICSVEKWQQMTDDEAEMEARGSFHESGYSEDYDIETLDWWY